jgi:uncharacterized protein (TIGR03437 family)
MVKMEITSRRDSRQGSELFLISNSPFWRAFAISAVIALAAEFTSLRTEAAVSLAAIKNDALASPASLFSSGSGAPMPTINPGGIVNAAGYAPQVAPGSIAAVFGSFLLTSPLVDTTLPLSTNLSGLALPWLTICAPQNGVCPQIALGGDAPLFYVSGTQVNIQIPWEMLVSAPGPGQLQWQSTIAANLNGQAGAAQTIDVVAFAPAIFTTNSQGTGPGAILDSSYRLVNSSNPAHAGSDILIYCTGLGAVTNQPATGAAALSFPLSATTTTPTVMIGEVPVAPSFSGLAPGYVGLYQVNALVPAGTPTGEAVPVVVSIGGVASNVVTIPVQ